jgi:23S rRNA (cytidine1920-2'-O)/16S rRNA (cytidine1409-2'-O)-methyltransferase
MGNDAQPQKFASRAGLKLDHALKEFDLSVDGLVCADFGCSTGGFVDVMLQNGASKVYAIDTGYGVLDWKLRNDERVIVMERTNALHVELDEKMDLITIDASWTKQHLIVPVAFKNLKDDGKVITLVKPHYEAEKAWLEKGKVKEEFLSKILDNVRQQLLSLGFKVLKQTESPIVGEKGGNKEYLWLLSR